MLNFEEKITEIFDGPQTISLKTIHEADWTNIPSPEIGKTLNDLKKLRDHPLDNGWTVDEVMSAMRPSLIAAARKYSTPNFSKDEALLAAMEGLVDALRTYNGSIAFPSHAFRTIKSKTMRAAAGTKDFPTSNISGIKPHEGGRTDFLKGSRATISADVKYPSETKPRDEEDDKETETLAQQVTGDIRSGEKTAQKQTNIAKLLFSLFRSKEVGLTDTERIVMQATYGIDKEGNYSESGPRNTNQIASAFGVSPVRISQIRKKSQRKIQKFLASKGIESEEEAMEVFGLGEAKLIITAKMVIESIVDILNIDLDILKENSNDKYFADIASSIIRVYSNSMVNHYPE